MDLSQLSCMERKPCYRQTWAQSHFTPLRLPRKIRTGRSPGMVLKRAGTHNPLYLNGDMAPSQSLAVQHHWAFVVVLYLTFRFEVSFLGFLSTRWNEQMPWVVSARLGFPATFFWIPHLGIDRWWTQRCWSRQQSLFVCWCIAFCPASNQQLRGQNVHLLPNICHPLTDAIVPR